MGAAPEPSGARAARSPGLVPAVAMPAAALVCLLMTSASALAAPLDRGGAEALRAELEGLFTYRVGRMRVVYRLPSRRIIEIVAIGPRKTIYQETYILLKKTKA